MDQEIVELLVPKLGNVADLLDVLQRKLNIPDEAMHNIRLIESHQSKIYRELTTDLTLANINEFVTIYAEVIPDEEREANTETDRAVYAFHFDKEPARVHNVPFKFIVKEGEVFADTKLRISKRTGLKGKNLEKVKFAVVSRSNFAKPEYLEDEDVLSEKLISGEDQLGLDHMNKTRNVIRDASMMIR
jgi:ubiquitin carboxyl-terminal hydrolase 7